MSSWETFIKRTAESRSSDYNEICMCHNPERYLRFDINTKEYYGVNGCKKEFVCAMLQIAKHQAIIKSRKRRFEGKKDKTEKEGVKESQNYTLDQFFTLEKESKK
ncbi:MAG: hypothetical protein GF308_14955 [Candidatus Heimdallarchaeota archaeon]|nr:hypothetical protein [Candidatus Heimdallarchaeota archaeon]